ncbi:MAG: hypothetical protein WC985_03850 [Thermoplasmata archaeon]
MKRSEILQRLEERLARGEISEKTYIDIKARYDSEPEEASVAEAPAPSLEASIHEAVARATEEAARTTEQAVRAAGEAMRAVDFSGFGAKISDESIKILGSGVVSGNPVKTVEFKAAGSAQVRGPLECETVKVSGSCDFDGDVRCVEFRSAGSSRIAGSLHTQDVDVSGSLQVGKDLQAVDIASRGSLRVNGDVSGQDFHSSGSVRIEGELKVVDVDIELGGSSRVRTIEGQDISVRTTGGFIRTRGDLTAERITGVDVDLEGTTAGYVEGQDVRIGPHCRIDVVVAQDLVVHESSEVKERRVPAA